MTSQGPDPETPEDYLRKLQQDAAAPPPTAPYAVNQPGYGEQGYGQAGYGQTAPHQQPVAGAHGYYPPLPPPGHPSATTAMVLGIIGLASTMVACGVGLFLSPFAWVLGSRAVAEIDANPGRYSGRDKANAGRITGIIGTVLLVLGLLLLIVVVAGMVMFSPDVTQTDTYNSNI